jgi:hypothetical protein
MSPAEAYPGPYGVDNEASAALVILPGVRNENWHFRVLAENLLYTAVVDTLADISWARMPGVILLSVVIVAETIARCSGVGGRVSRRTGGRRGFAVIDSFTSE